MPHPQSSWKGLWAKQRYDVAYSGGSQAITADSTGVILSGQIKVQNAAYIGHDGTSYLFSTRTALPQARHANNRVAFIKDSTGRFNIGINTTGTTWKFLRVTSVITG